MDLGFEIIGYDIFEILVNFWNEIKNNKENFILELKKFNITKEEFTKNRHILMEYWNTIKPINLIYNSKKYDLMENEKILLINNKLLQSVY